MEDNTEKDKKPKEKELLMTLETFLNHYHLSKGIRLYHLKTFGKDKTEKTFKEWSKITGLKQ